MENLSRSVLCAEMERQGLRASPQPRTLSRPLESQSDRCERRDMRSLCEDSSSRVSRILRVLGFARTGDADNAKRFRQEGLMRNTKRRKKLPLTGVKDYDCHIKRYNRENLPVTPLSLIRFLQKTKTVTSAANVKQQKFAFLKALSLMGYSHRIYQAKEVVRAFRVAVQKTTIQPEDVLSVDEVLLLLKHSPRRWAILFLFLFSTGARIASALAIELKRCHPDHANGVVICYSVGKGAKLLDYEVSLKLFSAIRNLFPGDRYLFELAGKRLSYSTVRQGVKRLGFRILKKRVTCHLFRHSLATLLVEQGVPLIEVKHVLHHSSVQVTADFYVHVRPNRQRIRPVLATRELTEALDALIVRPQARGIRGANSPDLRREDSQGFANPVPRPEGIKAKEAETNASAAG
jgi:integrase